MRPLFAILGFTALLSFTLPSCESKEDREAIFTLDQLDNLLDTSGANLSACVNCGMIVPTRLVKPCLTAFTAFMESRDFDIVKRKNPMCFDSTAIYTDYEAFRGHELLRFLRRAARMRTELLGKYKHLTVSIMLGLYTKEYLAAIGNTDNTKLGRIAIFLVTCDRPTADSAGLSPNKSYLVPIELAASQDSNSFDFGNIHP